MHIFPNRQLVTDSTYNSEKLRHKQTHADARKEYEAGRRQYLKQELQSLQQEQTRYDSIYEQVML